MKIDSRISSLIIAILIFISGLFVLASIERTQPLVHDEAVYLTKARSLLENTPANEFRIYRPIGMVYSGWVILHFDKSEKSLRIFGIFFGALTLLFIYLLFEKITGKIVAIFISLTVLSSTIFLQNAPQFLNDVPSTGFLIACMWVILDYYKTKGESNLIYLLGPFSATAFYLRYGTVTSLVVIMLASIVILGPKFIKNRKTNLEKILDTILLTFLLFLPHFIEAIIATNNLLGILIRSGKAAGRKYLGEGLINYLKWMPNQIGGWLFGTLSIIGIAITIIFIFNKKLRNERMELFWIGSIASISFIITGLLVHAEMRYIFFPTVLFIGIAISFIFSITKINKLLKYSFIIVYSAAITFTGYKNYEHTLSFFYDKATGSRLAYVKAASITKKDTTKNGKECVIWATSFRPELSWYSKCYTVNIKDKNTFKKDFLVNFRRNKYTVVFSRLPNQLNKRLANEYDVELVELFRTKISNSLGDLILYKIHDKKGIRFEPIKEEEPK